MNSTSERVDLELNNLARFVFFIGHPRSSHSLIGQFLNAHSDCVISHELNVFQKLESGKYATKNDLYRSIIERNQWFIDENKGRWSGYDYLIDFSTQLNFKGVRFIGDKNGGGTTPRLFTSPELIDQIKKLTNLPIRIIYVLRNPLDNIATIATKTRGMMSVDLAIEKYGLASQQNQYLLDNVFSQEEYMLLHNYELVSEPEKVLFRLANHVGFECTDHWLLSCTERTFKKQSKTRFNVFWNKSQIKKVEQIVCGTPHLSPYLGSVKSFLDEYKTTEKENFGCKAFVHKSALSLSSANFSDARKSASKALLSAPSDVDALVQASLVEFMESNYKKAYNLSLSAIKIAPENHNALLNHCRAASKLCHSSEFNESLSKMGEVAHVKLPVYEDLIRLLCKKGAFFKAVKVAFKIKQTHHQSIFMSFVKATVPKKLTSKYKSTSRSTYLL